MADPLSVVATRGSVVEARHSVHAVAVRDGRIVASAGDPGIVSFLRSSAKPIQALPLVRARPDLGDRELAIACASHRAEPDQLAAVRALLDAAPASEDELETGADPTPIQHTCSGKHAGFLALCRARGWEAAGYGLEGHPLQRAMLEEVAAAAEAAPSSIATGIDGCGVLTFALTLERCAHVFGRFRALEGGGRVIAAMRARPDLVRGPIAADSLLMETLDGWVAKGGAEGLFCAGAPDGLGIALKVEDGAFRAIRPALGSFLARLGIDAGEVGVVTLHNSRREAIGGLSTVSKTRVPK